MIRNTTLTALTTAMILLTGCQAGDGPTDPQPQVAMTPPTRPSLVTVSETENPFTFPMFSPCTGETLMMVGVYHQTVTTNVDESGGIHTGVHTIVHGLSGTATLSGKKYVAQENSQFHMNEIVPPVNSTQMVAVKMLRTGENGQTLNPLETEDDFMLHFVFHLTVNGNGVISSQFTHGDPAGECK